MSRRTVTRGSKKFYYYVCSSYKHRKSCTVHNFEQTKLHDIILNAITNQINLVVELNKLLDEVGLKAITGEKLKRLDLLITQKHKDIDRCKEMRMNLYEALGDNLIERSDYESMRKRYSEKIEAEERVLNSLVQRYAEEKENVSMNISWIQEIIKFHGVKELTRELIVTMIDKIYVYEDKRVRIEFNYRNEFSYMQDLLQAKVKEGR